MIITDYVLEGLGSTRCKESRTDFNLQIVTDKDYIKFTLAWGLSFVTAESLILIYEN